MRRAARQRLSHKRGVADDLQALALLSQLPLPKQQPNLRFACAMLRCRPDCHDSYELSPLSRREALKHLSTTPAG
ncbi:MAG TPA: hypothetical protein VFU07_00045 [Candidatus Lumbricidophila sp.]|nr:hypothetical protein [Candidatus Lumbricidophila sp.]